MGRRKIRHFGPYAYEISPEDNLVALLPPGFVVKERPKPRHGPGSGRAGGARSAIHVTDHVSRGRVYLGTSVTDCPICRYGMVVWNLWENSKGGASKGC